MLLQLMFQARNMNFFLVYTGDGWKAAPELTPPHPIAADRRGDLGCRFIDLNGDGRMDVVFHRWISHLNVKNGAYINNGHNWQWSPEFIPPYHISAKYFEDHGARYVDLNADGRDDLIYYRKFKSKVYHFLRELQNY